MADSGGIFARLKKKILRKGLATKTTEVATSPSTHLLVAAFDFGTTYSGYAFSFLDDPTKIQTNQGWNAGSEKLISLKTPTCVLLRPDEQFDSFGFEAQNRYADLAEDDKHHGWMLFRRFKMLLHNNDGLSRSSTIEDINGKSMPAIQIFSMAIGFLRDHLLKALNCQTVGVKESDIQYVLTVPAIWNDNAKQFMREAAEEAGLNSARLKLCLEPEAASIWCQTVNIDMKSSFSDIGCKYMVVDLGGGTADISVHQKKADGSLKEIHKASGGPWGGTAVDKNYFDWLTNLFGLQAMQRFKSEQMADYFDVQREFETTKRRVSSDTQGKITFRVSTSLREISGTDLKSKFADMGLNDKVTFTSDRIRLDASIVRSWFKEPIMSTITHIKNLLAEQEMKTVKQILLVGGFGESQLAQDELRNKLQNKTVIVPNEAGLAVLKGAVRFGHVPEIVSSRVMKYTYGIAVSEDFDEERHSESNVEYDEEGNPIVNDMFHKFVTIGEDVPTGNEITHTFTPRIMMESDIEVYCTTDPNPYFIDDPGCRELGILLIHHEEGEIKDDKEFEVNLMFGETELVVKAIILATGKEFFTSIDCLK